MNFSEPEKKLIAVFALALIILLIILIAGFENFYTAAGNPPAYSCFWDMRR